VIRNGAADTVADNKTSKSKTNGDSGMMATS
jgi:hypothetical protein